MKNNIKKHSWKLFKVGDIFPRVPIKKHSKKPEIEGQYQFISSTSLNNGVSGYVDEKPIKGNCITVSTNGACFDAFYHEEQIVVSSDVEVLYNDNLNKYNSLFICTILKLEKPKWTYGRKPKNNHVFQTEILLPESDGNPDWNYMEKYIKDKWINTIKTDIGHNHIDISNIKWKEFKVEDIIQYIYKAKPNHKIYLESRNELTNESVQYITRTDTNNGLGGFVFIEEQMTIEKENALTLGDTTATVFFQDLEFICGDHIIILRDPNLNKYTGLFIRTLLNHEKYRYSYGRAFTIDKLKNTLIKIPSKDEQPDWKFMELYIKQLPYSDKI